MVTTAAQMTRIRSQVSDALEAFIARQRSELADISPELLACTDAITDFLSGGKRLRAAFCYWAWRGCGGADGPGIITAAAALELLHASALVHDDVMDGSDTRRGQPAVHRRFAAMHAAGGWRGSADGFGTGAAILIGDLLLAWTDEMLRGSGLPGSAVQRGLGVLDDMRTEVLCGQFLDIAAQARGECGVDSALRVVTYKSAKYTVERPLHLGAALAGQDPSGLTAAAFTGYGVPLGIAFQLRDDVLGVFGDPAVTGKPVTDDLREGKRTVLLALARERASRAEAELLDRSVGDPNITEARAEEVQAVISGTGALAECELMIESKVKEALCALDAGPVTGEAAAALADLAVAATSRTD